jgi:hypothetical protein
MFGRPAHPLPKLPEIESLEATIARAAKSDTAGVIFSEVMSGFIYSGSDVKNFEVATNLARGRCESARFFLSTRSWDTADCK